MPISATTIITTTLRGWAGGTSAHCWAPRRGGGAAGAATGAASVGTGGLTSSGVVICAEA